jgi:hypothetical protein
VRAYTDAALTAHANDKRYTVFQLVELIGPATTYRYTDAPISIVWGGFTWTNVWFSGSELVTDGDGEVTATLTFEDVSRTIRTLALANNLNTFAVRLSEVWADANNTTFGQDVLLWGKCDGVRCDGSDTEDPRAAITVRGLFADSAVGIGPLQDFIKNCRYQQFKGPQCKYAGAQVFCDRQYSTCLNVMANTINFGGFRFALGADARIQWGTNVGSMDTRPVPSYTPAPPPSSPPAPTQWINDPKPAGA